MTLLPYARRMSARPLVCCLFSLTLLAGCANNDAPVAGTPPSPTLTTPPTASAPATAIVSTPTAPATTGGCPTATATALPFTATTAPDTETAIGGPLGLQGTTAGPQPGYDRVVFTLAGNTPGQPGWDVMYVTAPTSDGSGDPVAVAGSSYLEVAIKDVGYPQDTGVPDPGVKQVTPTCTKFVKQVVLDTVFEGRLTAFIGLSATKPFRVFRLANPARVVVDVRHS